MKNISRATSDLLCENGAISKEDADICRYGLEIFFSSVLELITIFVISAFVGNFAQTVLFFALMVYSNNTIHVFSLAMGQLAETLSMAAAILKNKLIGK